MSIPAQLGALLVGSEVELLTVVSAIVELQQALGGKVAVYPDTDTPQISFA